MDTVIQSQMDTVIHSLRQRFRQTRSSSRSSSSRMQHYHHHNDDDDGLEEAYTPDLMPPTSASTSHAPTPLPTTSAPVAAGVWQRGSSVRSRKSLMLLKHKIFGHGSMKKLRTNEDAMEATISTAPSSENIVWTAPSSPQIGSAANGANIPRRRNSARLRELQRLLRSYHEQRNGGWASTPSSPKAPKRHVSAVAQVSSPVASNRSRQNSTYSNVPEFYADQRSWHAVDMPPVSALSYCRSELGPERPLVLDQDQLSDKQIRPGPNVLRRMNLSELELALLNGANPSCPSSLITSSSQPISPPPRPPQPLKRTDSNSQPCASSALQHHHGSAVAIRKHSTPAGTTADQFSTKMIGGNQVYLATNYLQHEQQYQVVSSSSKELRYQGGTTVVSTTYCPSKEPPTASPMDFVKDLTTQPHIIDLPLISPSPYEQIRSYVAPQAIVPSANATISNQIKTIDQQQFGSKMLEMQPMEKQLKQKKKKRRNKVDKLLLPKMQQQIIGEQQCTTEARIHNVSNNLHTINGSTNALPPKSIKPRLNASPSSKSGAANFLSMGFHHLIQRQHLQPLQEDQMKRQNFEPMLKMARSEPRLATRASRREHWLLMSRPELPGSSFLSPTPSIAALEHLDRLRDRISETKYVTAVFESRGGLGPVLSDVQAELEHWLGDTSNLLAIACEVHWSVPERFRSRQLEIELKQCLHAVLRVNNRRVLSLNDNNDEEAAALAESPADSPLMMPRNARHRSYSTHSLNHRPLGRPFPIALARSKTEESCIRDAELDAFQGIYRRFYPALLQLQDQATVKAHKDYWTLESLTDERKAPLVPDPARFLYQPEQPAQLARKSLVAVNMAVLRMLGDERDYDVDEARYAVGHAVPGLKESDL